MSKVTTGYLTFQVHGEYVTKHFRSLYERGQDINIVIDKLTKSINDLPDEIAKDIILGKKKFEGVNTFTLLPDSQTITSYKEDMKKVALDRLRAKRGLHEYNHGWINPEGEFYACEYMAHIALLIELQKYDLIDDASERVMEKKGWMKLSNKEFHYYAFMGIRDDRLKPMTKEQMNFIYDYTRENDIYEVKINGSKVSTYRIFDYLEERYGEKKV